MAITRPSPRCPLWGKSGLGSGDTPPSDPCPFDILQSGPGWRVSNAIRSIEALRRVRGCFRLWCGPRRAHECAPLLDGNSELRPVLHLHARDQLVLAALGFENRRFAFLHIEPLLPEGVDDVGLMRDQESVFALFGRPRQHIARRLFSSGDTTRPPSVRSVVFLASLDPARTAV